MTVRARAHCTATNPIGPALTDTLRAAPPARFRAGPSEEERVPLWSGVVCAGVIANYLRVSRGRRVDVTWLLQDAAYARHIVYLARQSGDASMLRYAARLEQALAARARL